MVLLETLAAISASMSTVKEDYLSNRQRNDPKLLQQMRVLALKTYSSAYSPLTPIPVVDVVKLPLCSSICRLPHRMAGGVSCEGLKHSYYCYIADGADSK